jgi:hypothetical protein
LGLLVVTVRLSSSKATSDLAGSTEHCRVVYLPVVDIGGVVVGGVIVDVNTVGIVVRSNVIVRAVDVRKKFNLARSGFHLLVSILVFLVTGRKGFYSSQSLQD